MDDQRTLEPASERRWLPALLAWGILALLGAGLLLLRASSDVPRPTPQRAAPLAAPAALAEQQPVPAVETPRAPAPVLEAPTELAGYDPNHHAHPITPEHLRLYRETELLEGAWQALRKRDVAKARELVATHQSEYPDSNQHMDEGLLLLANCIERPGAETRALAQVFYDTKTYSPMRRRLRRLCLALPD